MSGTRQVHGNRRHLYNFKQAAHLTNSNLKDSKIMMSSGSNFLSNNVVFLFFDLGLGDLFKKVASGTNALFEIVKEFLGRHDNYKKGAQ